MPGLDAAETTVEPVMLRDDVAPIDPADPRRHYGGGSSSARLRRRRATSRRWRCRDSTPTTVRRSGDRRDG